jgi:hypothetical protein
MFDELLRWLIWLFSFWQVKFLMAHIGLNVIVAIAASIYIHEFLLARTGEFLYRKVLPYLLIYAAFAAMGQAANLSAIGTAAFVALEAMLLADLLDNLKSIGLPIPPGLTQDLISAKVLQCWRQRRIEEDEEFDPFAKYAKPDTGPPPDTVIDDDEAKASLTEAYESGALQLRKP